MEPIEQPTVTKPTALQTTSVAATRPRLVIGGSFIIVLIIILLEIYAPRDKTNPPSADINTDTGAMPAAIEPAEGATNGKP